MATEAAEMFNNDLNNFLKSKPDIIHEVKTFYKHNKKFINNLEEAKKLKILREKKSRQNNATPEDRSLACEALRHYDFLLKEKKQNNEAAEIVKQEKAYTKNFHKFAKEVTKGTYNKSKIEPTYSLEEANEYYKCHNQFG